MTRSQLQPDITPRTLKSAVLSGIAALTLSVVLGGSLALAQSGHAAGTAQASPAPSASPANTNQTRSQRRAARRRQRAAEQQARDQAAQQQAGSNLVGPTPEQRARDAKLLAAQKAQSNASASENDALTQKVIADQQKQQAEPRIQDAPGPDSTPLAGQPAVLPAQSSEPPRIQDAPGPAQTLPKAPPAAPAPVPEQTPAPAPEQ